MVEPNKDLRSELNIPPDALVFGRHGGDNFGECCGDNRFNLEFVPQCVYDIAKNNKNIYFLFMNTEPFCEDLENIIHLPKTIDEQFKSNFINTCDAMIHARTLGESFGLAIAEFLYQDKPVVSYKGGTDENHIYMMGKKGMWYEDYDSLRKNILTFRRLPPGSYKKIVEKYNPKNVMKKFHDVFVKGGLEIKKDYVGKPKETSLLRFCIKKCKNLLFTGSLK